MIELVPPDPVLENLQAQVAWLNDRELMRYSEQRYMDHSVASQYDYVRSFLDSRHNILREIRNDKGALVGTISAYVDINNRVADIGILIGSGYGGKGYGYEAWSKLGDILFENLNLRRIEAGCMVDNAPMIKIMRRYGMREEGRRQSHFIVDGRYSDLVLYGRFR